MRFWDALLERYIGAARQALGEDAAARRQDEGRAISLDEAVARSLASSVMTS
jgi:hypothetical protein